MEPKTHLYLFALQILLCTLQNHFTESKPITADDLEKGFVDKSKSNKSTDLLAGIWGAKKSYDDGTASTLVQVYANLKEEKRPAFTYEGGVEVGLVRIKYEDNNNTQSLINNMDVKILSAGIEGEAGLVGGGAMVRASVIDATINTGPIGFNLAITADTGLKADLAGIEVKFLGTGGKISKDGIQVCVIVCLMINW